jgi:two-component system nitrate/nitrite response regulator NarL
VFPRELIQSPITQGAPEPAARPLGRRALLKDLPRLSPREADMLRCLVRGCSNKVISDELSIPEAMVKIHLRRLFRKLRVANRTQAALWAHKHGYDASEG